jgi:hypothetical protein
VDDLSGIVRLVDALRPWRKELVIVGGWAHRLHRLHPWAGKPAYASIRTRDADVAFSLDSAPHGDIRSALLAAGFTESLSSEHRPPISEYRLGEEDGGFYAEFLAPLKGSGLRRNGAEDATVERAGVTAQKLRHLDLLLMQPFEVRLDDRIESTLVKPSDILIANPVSFIAQKLLIRRSRKPDKQAQDVLYIHDTIELFAGRLGELHVVWRDGISAQLHRKTIGALEQLREEQFGKVDDVIRRAARIPVGRSLTPERMLATCALGLAAILEDDR